MHQAPGLLTWCYKDESQSSPPGTHGLVGRWAGTPQVQHGEGSHGTVCRPLEGRELILGNTEMITFNLKYLLTLNIMLKIFNYAFTLTCEKMHN